MPNAVLNPRDTWRNEEEYDEMAHILVTLFHENFKQFEAGTDPEIVAAGPVF